VSELKYIRVEDDTALHWTDAREKRKGSWMFARARIFEKKEGGAARSDRSDRSACWLGGHRNSRELQTCEQKGGDTCRRASEHQSGSRARKNVKARCLKPANDRHGPRPRRGVGAATQTRRDPGYRGGVLEVDVPSLRVVVVVAVRG